MIRIETRREHPTLGALYFDDGASPVGLQVASGAPHWVARPSEDEELEYYVAGSSGGPDPSSLARAEQVAQVADRIRADATAQAGRPLTIAWFDCREVPPIGAFTDEVDVYNLWRARLDENSRPIDLQAGSW